MHSALAPVRCLLFAAFISFLAAAAAAASRERARCDRQFIIETYFVFSSAHGVCPVTGMIIGAVLDAAVAVFRGAHARMKQFSIMYCWGI
jgi:hypothetical protein